ncbi:MAG: hypothetical protein V3W41_00955 [Planctomycetota bacterium]
MSASPKALNTALRRTEYLVDRPMQLRAAVSVAGLLGVVGVACALVMYMAPTEEFFAHLSPQEVKAVFTYATAAFFFMGLIVVVTCAIVFTHRVAGSSRVLVAALEGMMKGDYGKRVGLRDKDYLKDLSAAIGKMQRQLSEERSTNGQ